MSAYNLPPGCSSYDIDATLNDELPGGDDDMEWDCDDERRNSLNGREIELLRNGNGFDTIPKQ